MWFKYGLKAQKLIAQGNGHKQHAPSGRAAYMGSSSFRAYWVIPTVQFENFSTYSSCM